MSFKNPLGLRRFGKRKKIRKLKRPRNLRQWLALALKLGALLIILLVLAFAWFSKDLPTAGKLKAQEQEQSTQILDKDGNLLFALSGDKKRILLDSSEIPQDIKDATIAIEDNNFYHHHGIDIKGLVRAIWFNIVSHGFSQGGSTITQQFVKNSLLSPRKTLTRKIKELILSLEIEAIYSKDKILTFYLNEIPYGSTAYGIEAASQLYFHKSAKDLSLAQSAVLAAMPQRPTYFSPYGSHLDELLKRKDKVLKKMLQLGYITEDEYKRAKQEKIEFSPRGDSIKAPHFVFYVQEILAEKYGEEMVRRGGLKVTTTLDPKVQEQAISAIKKNERKLLRYGANNASLVAVEPSSGKILAMVGSRDYFNDEIQGQVNVTVANRQPGSSFKPIVYATAFKEKYNPAYPIFDLRTDFGGNYTPKNYDGSFSGPVSMRDALARSLNVPAVKTLALVGINKALETARDLGITTLTQPERYGLSLVLGGGEVKPLEMAGAFSVFANQGKKVPVVAITKVEDSKGKVLEEYEPPFPKQVLDPQIAFEISSILSDNAARSPVFGNIFNFGSRLVALKTGTTQEYRDAWTVGFTPQIASAVWVGNSDNSKMRKGAAGSVVAGPIFRSFMLDFLSDKEALYFEKPQEVQELQVDFLSNKLPTEDSPQDEIKKDFFASWQVTDKTDDVHKRVRLNRLNGKLATELTPPELIEEKVFGIVHSAQPENPNWEEPVRNWAREHSLDQAPPQELDDMYSLDKYPLVKIINPSDNAVLQTDTPATISCTASYQVREIKLALDSVEIAKDSSGAQEVSLTVPVSGLDEANRHTLIAFCQDKNGVEKSSLPIHFKYQAGSVAIENVSATTTATTATITWLTDKPATSQVVYSQSPNNLNSSSILSNKTTTNHSVSLGSLLPATTYYFQVRSKVNGLSASSDTLTFTTKNAS